jgi:hypothetical protein
VTVSDFDARIAKLQEKILMEVGEPVPDDIRVVADQGIIGRKTPSRSAVRHRAAGRGASYILKNQGGGIERVVKRSGASGEAVLKKGPMDGTSLESGIHAVVNLGAGKEDSAKVRLRGKDVIIIFDDAESAKEAIGEIAANKSIAVQRVGRASQSVKGPFGFGNFSKKWAK